MPRFVGAGNDPWSEMNSDRAHKGVNSYQPARNSPAGPLRGPTALRVALGAQLRRLRGSQRRHDRRGGRRDQGSAVEDQPAGARRTTAKQRDVADLLTLYGITDGAEREGLLELARQAGVPGWWQQYNDVMPRWFEYYIGLERAASVIRSYEVQFIQGLLQTEDYARTVILIGTRTCPPTRSTAG